MIHLANLSQRVALRDPSLTPGDFVRAHNEIDALFARYTSDVKHKADQFTKPSAGGQRLAVAARRAGIELSLPTKDQA